MEPCAVPVFEIYANNVTWNYLYASRRFFRDGESSGKIFVFFSSLPIEL